MSFSSISNQSMRVTNQDVELEWEEKKKKEEKNHSKEPNKQPTLHQSIEWSQPYGIDFPGCKKQDTSLVDTIAVDIQPTSIVEDKRFQKFVNALDHRYVLPSRRTIMRSMLPARYERVRKGLKVQLSSVQYCALTCDLCMSRQALGYITVTCNFIDKFVGSQVCSFSYYQSHRRPYCWEHCRGAQTYHWWMKYQQSGYFSRW